MWGRASKGSLLTWFGTQVLFCTALFRQVCLGLPAHRLAPKQVKRKPFHGLPTRRQAPRSKSNPTQVPKPPVTTFRNPACNPKRDKGRQSKVILTCHGRQGETKGDKAKSSQPSIRGRQGEAKRDKGKQSKIISAQPPDTPWETKGDKPWETRRDKERQSKAIPPQHPDTPRETKGGKAKSSQPSVQTRHGRQGETKQSEPTPASRHAMGDKGRRRETNQPSIRASRHTMGDKGKQRETFFPSKLPSVCTRLFRKFHIIAATSC